MASLLACARSENTAPGSFFIWCIYRHSWSVESAALLASFFSVPSVFVFELKREEKECGRWFGQTKRKKETDHQAVFLSGDAVDSKLL